MNRLSKFLPLLVLTLVVQQAFAQRVKEERKVSSYDAVSVSTGIDVYIRQGNRQEVTVEVDRDDLDDLMTEVRGGELKIYFENNNSFWSWKDREATVYVTVTNVKSIKSSSGSDVTGETIIVSDYLEVESSSGADLKLQVRARTLRAESSSGSDMELSGEAEYFEGRSSSGSDLDAMDLVAKKAKVRASSGSDLAITVTDDIEADASSGSDISYSGRPQYVNIDESSGGDVRRRNY
ncbi:MAG: head GIN domain-containing protein [Imperialibacter sp.]|uniref:head GIN domain-containing protein n=1 Tax=Imperialibacter sp. TaxID=2038411 RepID=UPI0032F05937